MANSILSHMMEKARQCGVTVRLTAIVPWEIPFNDYEFAAVIANLLENAVRCVSEPGDEILTFAPYFPEYGPYINLTGAALKVVPADTESFQINSDSHTE